MRHQQITPGDLVQLKPNNPYGLDTEPWRVVSLVPRRGYTVPHVACASRRPEGGLVFFRPSELRQVV